MKRTKRTNRHAAPLALAILALGGLAAASPAQAARPPAGRTYFIVALGIPIEGESPYRSAAGCLSFDATRMCDQGGDCGSWQLVPEGPPARKRWAFSFDMELVEDASGDALRIEGSGRIDARGRRSALGATAHGTDLDSGAVLNFAVAGRAVRAARCERLVDEFTAARGAGRTP